MPDPSYSEALSADGSFNQARFDLGDVGHIKDDGGTAVFILKDSEILAQITGFGYKEGVARCADSCCTRTAQEPDLYEDEGRAKVQWSERQRAWKYLATRLRSGAGEQATSTQVPITVAAGVTNPVCGSTSLGIR